MLSANAKPPSVPRGVRVYAVGDIHGRMDLLERMLQTLDEAEEAWPSERAILIFLGDYIDRGPDSCGVLDLLTTGLPIRFETVFLRGNHEEMMMRSMRSSQHFDLWAINGGLATIRSYGVEIDEDTPLRKLDIRKIRRKLGEAVPKAHKDFMSDLLIKVEAGDYLFVHAGVRPGIPLNAQSDVDCMQIRDEFLSYRGNFGKVIVHGHTPLSEPESLPNRIGIDTGAFFTGRLTAVCLEDNMRRFITIDENNF